MVPEPSKLIETPRGAPERECEELLNKLIRDVQRETAEECAKIADAHDTTNALWNADGYCKQVADEIRERFGLKEPK